MVALVKSIQDSEFVQGIREEAAECSLPINVGVHEPTHGGKTVQNTLLWIDERGDIKQRYQKLHLFDVDIKGGPVLKESNSVERGTKILPPFETGLRFPEMSLALRRQNAEIITFPSAFTVPTGQAHWEVLLRARAIETQAYIIAAAQCGAHNEKRTSYGHSMVVDPWGQIVAELGGTFVGPELATAKIDIDLLGKIRREIPLTRRTDVYPQSQRSQLPSIRSSGTPSPVKVGSPPPSPPIRPARLNARNPEYHRKILSNAFGGNSRLGCYALAATIFSLGIFRDLLYERALRAQPSHPLLQNLPSDLIAYALLISGNTLVLSSMWALGLTGTYLGDYFGILMDDRVTSFPFNITDAPMYYGSTLSFLGTAILYGKPAGFLLTAEVLVVYLVALRFEDPFTSEIYAKRERQRKSAGKKAQ
ncbi:MAG: Carbon-nitrogen hydrolase [Caeruleum heppii]|nr:MAG: Carbon-nitrogen hydrolase [Caeruleum heppii]